MRFLRTSVSILLVICYTVLIYWAIQSTRQNDSQAHFDNPYLNFQAYFQPLLLLITLLSIISTYLLNPLGFKQYFRLGNLSATGESLPLFGIKKTDTWMKTGLSLSVVITSATAAFMFFQLPENIAWGSLANGWIWVLLFAASNAFGEEVIYRLGLVAPLDQQLSPSVVWGISAVLFGLPHYAGMPSGLIGAFMAGVLGYVLAKSLSETQGMFWAWFIHFLQDVVIMATLYLVANH